MIEGVALIYLFAKDGDVATWVFIVLLGIKWTAFNADEMVASADFARVNFIRGAMICHFL